MKILLFIIGLAIFGALGKSIEDGDRTCFSPLVMLTMFFFLCLFLDKKGKKFKKKREKFSDEIEKCIKSITEEYFSVLQTKYYQKVYTNDYGKTILDDWWNEEEYFVKEILVPDLIKALPKEYNIIQIDEHNICVSNNEFKISLDAYHVMHDEFLKLQEEKESDGDFIEINVETGEDYELFVEQVFKKQGYKVTRTKKTGDQGVDLIIEKDNIRTAVQCKFYSKPVGNKAVQEVIAGKGFYNCEEACVVTNSTFTKSAKQLAENSNVKLLVIPVIAI